MLSAGHQVLVLARKGQHKAQDRYAGGANVLKIGLDITPFAGTLSLISYFLMIIRAPATIIRTAISWKSDAIHVEDLQFSMPALIAARVRRLPMVLEFRKSFPVAFRTDLGFVVTGLLGRRILQLLVKVFTFLEILMCHAAKFVVCVSYEEKARLVRLGIPQGKIVVIMSLPKLGDLPTRGKIRGYRSPSPTVIFAGHLLPWKGVSLLLEAFGYLQKKMPEARLVVLGGGPSRPSLEKQARDLSIHNKASFLGWLEPQEAYDRVRASDVAVIPHLVNSMPSKLFTYMHCGRPIVASDYPDVRNVLQKAQCGLLFRPGDARSLAEAIRLVLAEKAFAYRLSRNAEKAARERFNWENESRKLIGLYSNLFH